ncbi:MAG: glycosyltransferase family 61 protein, partial [Alphaproteobacteria bacterium]
MFQIDKIVSCGDLIHGRKKPVTSTILGTLLEAEAYSRKAPFHLDTEYLSSESKDYFESMLSQLHCDAPPISLFQFSNATVVGQGTVILADGSLVHDSAAEFLSHQQVPHGVHGTLDNMVLNERGVEINGVTILVKRPWYRNFGHYLVDLMPILPSLCDAGVEVDNIIYGDVPPGALREIMLRCTESYFPAVNVIFSDDENPLNVKHLLYVQPVHVPPLMKHPIALRYTKDVSIQLFGDDSTPKFDCRRLYLSRQKVSSRHILNNEELEEYLSSQGFFIFYPEEFSFGEQIAAFQRAEVIVGAKGAAFTNLIFCSQNAHALLFFFFFFH